jgi:hypothetical protein
MRTSIHRGDNMRSSTGIDNRDIDAPANTAKRH